MADQARINCSSNAASAEELREAGEMYRLLVECSFDQAIFMLDPAGRVMSWNTGAERLTGYAESEIVGKNFSVLCSDPRTEPGTPEEDLEAAARLGRRENEGWRVRKDGTRLWATEVTTAIRNDAGDLLGFGKVARDLSAREQIGTELEASRERYRSLFENNPDPVFELDLDGLFTQVNDAVLRVTGYPREDLIGAPFLPLIAAHDLERTLNAFLGAVSGEAQSLEVELLTKSGERRTLNISAVPTYVDQQVNTVFGIAEDISERERAERERVALLIREQQARAAAELAEDRTRFLSESSRILAASLDYNETLRQVVHLAVPRLGEYCLVDIVEEDGSINRMELCHVDPAKEKILRDMQERYPLLDGRRSHPVLDVLQKGEAVFIPVVDESVWDGLAYDAEHLERIKELSPRSYIGVPLRARSRVLGVLSFVFSDPGRRYTRSDLEVAEELARRAAMAVDNARLFRAAVVANKSKSDFLATMSHELRTPLNAIIGYTSLFTDGVTGPVTETQQKHLGRIEGSARHLLRLIEEVLGFARMEAGKEQVTIEQIGLFELVHEASAIVEPLAHQKGLSLTTHVPDQPCTLETDAGKVRQILVNLLSNAIKFTDQGSVRLEALVEDRFVVLRVSDTGVGIPSEHLENVFQAFFQVDQGTARRAQGTGLGLAVTRHLVLLLGGEISVSSQPGIGTVVSVLLPTSTGASTAPHG